MVQNPPRGGFDSLGYLGVIWTRHFHGQIAEGKTAPVRGLNRGFPHLTQVVKDALKAEGGAQSAGAEGRKKTASDVTEKNVPTSDPPPDDRGATGRAEFSIPAPAQPVIGAPGAASHHDPLLASVSAPPRVLNNNKYQMGERLGEGGFATVYKALVLKTGGTVAIKQIKLPCYKPDPAPGSHARRIEGGGPASKEEGSSEPIIAPPEHRTSTKGSFVASACRPPRTMALRAPELPATRPVVIM